MKFLPFFLDRGPFLSLSLSPYSNLAKVKLFIKRGIHFKWAGQSTAAYQLNDLIRIQRCDFPFSFVLLFWKGGDGYLRQRICPHVVDIERVGIGKCTFRSHFHPRCIFSRNAEFPLDIYQPGSRYLLYRKECRVTLIRRGGYAVPPFRECDDTANSERIFRYPRLYKIL